MTDINVLPAFRRVAPNVHLDLYMDVVRQISEPPTSQDKQVFHKSKSTRPKPAPNAPPAPFPK